MREKYESLSAAVLRELAKARGMKGISTLKKAELVEAMLAEDEKEAKVQEAKKEAEGTTGAGSRNQNLSRRTSAPGKCSEGT